MDFVIPIKKIGMFTKSVLEGIHTFYNPKRILIVTNKIEIDILENILAIWRENTINIPIIETIDEEIFFHPFGLTMNDLKIEFDRIEKDENHREFGWWYQQLIKLGAYMHKDITDEYVVWDGDLIPLEKWDLVVYNSVNQKNEFYTAILQEQSKNEFNRVEYDKCICHLLGNQFKMSKPCNGTFVTHHMVFQTKHLREMFEHIKSVTGYDKWPMYIISLSHTYYRFSEYLLYATFMSQYDFKYHAFEKFGKNGIRFRETTDIIENIKYNCNYNNKVGFTYSEIKDYFKSNISYVQFEHVYCF
jgi:hypothetical protein